MESVLREQYWLSKEGNISLSESDNLADFEREVYLNFILEDKKKEQEKWKNK